MTPIDQLWVLAAAGLVMTMQIGFCMLEAGLVRAKNSINVALKNLVDFCLAALLFWAFGSALMFGSSPTGWIGTTGFFPEGGGTSATFLIFQIMFCATAATIVSGAVAERMTFRAYLVVTAIISGLIYPIAGGWAWNSDGWLYGMGFRDFAGSTVVHGTGAWLALAAVHALGARAGRFESSGTLVSPNSLVLSTVGVIAIFLGWLGFNGGSTLALNASVPSILVNTVLGGAGGCLATLLLVWWRHGVPELAPTLNGCIGGLVAITAGCNAFSAIESVGVGAIGGVISYGAMRLLERFKLDDVVGASAAHGFPGVWGTLAVGLFGDLLILDTGLSRGGQIQAQALGAVVFLVWAGGFGWVALLGLNRIVPLRIDAESERVGLNVSEHGASTELVDLLKAMSEHSKRGDFTNQLDFEPYSEVGQIATEYNRVIEKVLSEMELREEVSDRLREARDESERARRKIFSSLEYAQRIQRAILPRQADLDSYFQNHFVIYEPRDVVSGDFYWCRRLGDSIYCIVVDCTGHGVPGAFMSMIGFLTLEHIVVEKGVAEPAEILAELHTRVRIALGQDQPSSAPNRDGMEVSIVRIRQDEIQFAGAHQSLWWFLPTDGECQFGEIPGDRHSIGGGNLEPELIDFRQHTLPIQAGLLIFLQSDGLVQQPNHLRVCFGPDRLQNLLMQNCNKPMPDQARAIQKEFESFCGGSRRRDDVTLIGLRFAANPYLPS